MGPREEAQARRAIPFSRMELQRSSTEAHTVPFSQDDLARVLDDLLRAVVSLREAIGGNASDFPGASGVGFC